MEPLQKEPKGTGRETPIFPGESSLTTEKSGTLGGKLSLPKRRNSSGGGKGINKEKKKKELCCLRGLRKM